MKYLVTYSFKSWNNERELITIDKFDSIDDVIEVLHSIDVATDYNLISVVTVKE